MDARGFTVLEIVVALGLVGVLTAAALWHGSAWLPELRLDAAARQLVLELRLARGRAMAEQRQRRLVFSVAADTYRRQVRAGSAYEDDGPPVPLPDGIDIADCSAPGAAIAFAARGTASTFGAVALRNRGGRERRIIVDIAGRVRVQ